MRLDLTSLIDTIISGPDFQTACVRACVRVGRVGQGNTGQGLKGINASTMDFVTKMLFKNKVQIPRSFMRSVCVGLSSQL
jgi:hypothetical protein